MKFPIPAWCGSLVFHMVLFFVLFFLVRFDSGTRGAPGDERPGSFGIVLKSDSEQGTVYQNEQETFLTENDSASSSNTASADSDVQMETDEELNDWDFSESAPNEDAFQPSQFLPQMDKNVLGPTAMVSGSDANHPSTRVVDKIGTSSGRPGTGSEATVGVFGLQGTGHKFAFVFDRSESMNEHGGRPIREAKAELTRALDSLKSIHQLIVVFYNDEPAIYPPSQRAGSLIFATDDNKEAAKNFIRSITPAGGTNHERGLLAAVKCKPDVIFLLTDGEPKDDLKPRQLDRITRASGAVQINVIQFGLGPEPPRSNRLKTLAIENAGLYQYIEMGRQR